MNIHSSSNMMKKPDKRSDIIQAALNLIVEHGFHGTSMAMVAEKADVGSIIISRVRTPLLKNCIKNWNKKSW
jgi:hypothetical protein